MDNARTTSNRLRTENQELKTETKELKKNLVRWKTCSIPNNWGFKASFPKHIKSYGRGERPTQANHQKQRFRYGYVTPPAPKGERPNGSLSQWSVTSFGFGRNFAGFGKRLCAYSKKSLWCGARRDGWSRPLPLGAPDRWFLSDWFCAVLGYIKNRRNRIS